MFEWDEQKDTINQEKHGISFANAQRIFEGLILKGEDGRFDYQETRYRAIGQLDDLVVVVVYTMRGEVIRLISARLANKKERNAYYEAVKKSSG